MSKPTPGRAAKVSSTTAAESKPKNTAITKRTPRAGNGLPLPIANHAQIAMLAYRIWQDQGMPWGTDRDNWFEAERRLRAKAR